MASRCIFCFVLVLVAVTRQPAASEGVASPPHTCYCRKGGTATCSNKHLNSVPAITCETSDLLVLNLSWNNISVLERGAFQKLVTLQELILDNALVRLVHKDAFHNLKDLRKLDLSFNQIQQLHPETFQYLENLQELRLRQNPLTVLPNKIFPSLKSFTMLDLRSCELTYINEEHFRYEISPYSTLEASAWPASLYMDINENPLNCDCALKDLHELVLRSNQSLQYENLTCTQPEDLRGVPLRGLDSADLKCKPYEILYPLRNSTFLAPKGRNVTLSCRIANDPHLPWLKRWTFRADNVGKSVVDETSPRFVVSSSNMWLNLTIERVRRSDQGVYRCEVFNRSVRLRTDRKVRLVVVEESPDFIDLAGQTHNTPLLVGSIVILGAFLSVVLCILAAARRKSYVYKKTKVFKKNGDLMEPNLFYASSGEIKTPRLLPKRPGSEVLAWWLEYPEHLYEEVDGRHSLDHPTKQTARPGDPQYDCQHYLMPAMQREAEPWSQETTATYITVLQNAD